jgi:hypothetical protein
MGKIADADEMFTGDPEAHCSVGKSALRCINVSKAPVEVADAVALRCTPLMWNTQIWSGIGTLGLR